MCQCAVPPIYTEKSLPSYYVQYLLVKSMGVLYLELWQDWAHVPNCFGNGLKLCTSDLANIADPSTKVKKSPQGRVETQILSAVLNTNTVRK